MSNNHLWLGFAALTLLATGAVTLPRAASATPRGYLIAEMTVTDPETFKKYAAASTPVMVKFGGKFIARGGPTVAEEGAPPGDRFVIIEFESLAAARAFYESADYQAVAPIRMKSAHSRVFLVEGSTNP